MPVSASDRANLNVTAVAVPGPPATNSALIAPQKCAGHAAEHRTYHSGQCERRPSADLWLDNGVLLAICAQRKLFYAIDRWGNFGAATTLLAGGGFYGGRLQHGGECGVRGSSVVQCVAATASDDQVAPGGFLCARGWFKC